MMSQFTAVLCNLDYSLNEMERMRTQFRLRSSTSKKDVSLCFQCANRYTGHITREQHACLPGIAVDPKGAALQAFFFYLSWFVLYLSHSPKGGLLGTMSNDFLIWELVKQTHHSLLEFWVFGPSLALMFDLVFSM